MPTLQTQYDGTIWHTTVGTTEDYLPRVNDTSSDIYSYIVRDDSDDVDGYVSAGKSSCVGGSCLITAARHFVEYDTSAITRVPASATVKFFGSDNTFTSATMVCIETEWDGTLSTDDWNNHNESSPIAYTSIGGITYNAFEYLSFTIAGLNAIASRDTFQMVCVEALYDYTQTEPADNTFHRNNFFQNSMSTGAYDIDLSYGIRPSDKISSGKVIISSGKVTIK